MWDQRRRFLQRDIGAPLPGRTCPRQKWRGFFTGVLPGRQLLVIHRGVAMQDTYTLIRKAVARVLTVARMQGPDVRVAAMLKRTDYHQPGEPKIDWAVLQGLPKAS